MFRSAHNYLYRCSRYLLTRLCLRTGSWSHRSLLGQLLGQVNAPNQLPLGLRFTNEQKARGNRRSARHRAKTKTPLAYRAHALRRAGLSTKQIAAALGRSERSIRNYLATPFATVQATRQRIARPRPTLYQPATAAIC